MIRQFTFTWSRLAIVGMLAVLSIAAVACSDGDDDDDYYEDDVQPTSTSSSTSTEASATSSSGSAAATTAPSGGGSGSGSPPPIIASGDLQIMGLFDVVLTDLSTNEVQFELDVQNMHGENPRGSLEAVGSIDNPSDLIRQNFTWLREQGYSAIELFAAEGYGTVWLESPTLTSMRHDGIDYNSQPGDLERGEGYQRYYSMGSVFADAVSIAHELGFSVTANIESVAHIISRSSGEGIGGGGDTITLAGQLPAPSPQQLLDFIDEILATGVDSVSAEAYSLEYEKAIESHLASKNVPYLRAGADVGTVWTGYHYSFYPENEQIHDIHNFLYTTDSFIGVANGTIFARARALPSRPELALTVGGYNPLPCDTSKSLADVQIPVDVDNPLYLDGSPLDSCATGPWRNLILAAVRKQGVERVVLAADLAESIRAATTPGIANSIRERVDAHPAVDDQRPIANVIYDLPDFGPDDAYASEDIYEAILFSVSGLIDDALSAAGYQTVLTYDDVYQGADLAYVVTVGGNEETWDDGGQGPPYWSNLQNLPSNLVDLLDSGKFSGPVFIHPLFGIPEGGNWSNVRSELGLPARFEFTNPVMLEGYGTSLASSFNITSDGEIDESLPDRKLFADSANVLGGDVNLVPFGDFYPLGNTLHVASESEFSGSGPRVSVPIEVPTSGGSTRQDGVVLAGNDQGRFIWLTNQMHHEAFTWIVGQMIAEATGNTSVLASPTKSHVWSGRQTMALAYADTTLELNLPFESGEKVDITIYDLNSNLVSEDLGVVYEGSYKTDLQKWSLAVIEPSRN